MNKSKAGIAWSLPLESSITKPYCNQPIAYPILRWDGVKLKGKFSNHTVSSRISLRKKKQNHLLQPTWNIRQPGHDKKPKFQKEYIIQKPKKKIKKKLVSNSKRVTLFENGNESLTEQMIQHSKYQEKVEKGLQDDEEEDPKKKSNSSEDVSEAGISFHIKTNLCVVSFGMMNNVDDEGDVVIPIMEAQETDVNIKNLSTENCMNLTYQENANSQNDDEINSLKNEETPNRASIMDQVEDDADGVEDGGEDEDSLELDVGDDTIDIMPLHTYQHYQQQVHRMSVTSSVSPMDMHPRPPPPVPQLRPNTPSPSHSVFRPIY